MRSISVVLPTYREKESIRSCVERFLSAYKDLEIIVVDNNAEQGTIQELMGLPVRIVNESRQGYGAALKAGMSATTGELVIWCEPDGTFSPEDISKFLSYTEDCDVVFGTRTVQTFIWSGANMGHFIKWGNWFVAKLVEVLYNTSYMSDVGCTFRCLNRRAVDYILSQQFLSDGSSYGLEVQVEIVKSGKFNYVQIPVKYGPRVGVSSVTGYFSKTLALGLKMIMLVLARRLR